MMSIEQIIQRIDAKDCKVPRAGQFLYDFARSAIVDRPPLIGGSRVRAFQVASSLGGMSRAEGTLGPVLVQDPENGAWAKFHIDYQAWVIPNNAADLVRACADDDPGQRLVAWLIGLAQQVVGRDPSVLDHYGEPVIAAEREIEQNLLRKCGLTAIVRLRLHDDELTPTPDIQVDVDAHVADYPHPVKLRVTVLTELRTRERILAVEVAHRKPPPNPRRMTEQACRAALQSLPVAQLRIALHGEVARQIRICLEPALATCYIRIRELRLELREELVRPLESFDADLQVELAMRDYPTSVPLRIPIHLQLRDEAAYWRARGPALPAWVTGEGRQAVMHCLRDIVYSQLCLRAPECEERMLHGLRVAAGAIGYAVSARLDPPRPPERRFLGAFMVEIKGEFASAESDLRTQLSIAAQLRLDSMDSVTRHLDAGADLEACFREAILDEVTAYVHTLQAGQLYAHFDSRAPITAPLGAEQSPTRPTVESILRDKVEQTLRRRFGLRVLSFTAKRGTSEVQSVYAALIAGGTIEFRVDVKLRGQGAPVTHHAAIQVGPIRPEDWPQFHLRRPSVNDVRQAAERAMRSLVQEARTRARDGLEETQAQALAQDDLPLRIRDELGVTVRCVGWNRERSEDESKRWDVEGKMRDLAYEQQLKDYVAWQAEVTQLKNGVKLANIKKDHDGAQRMLRELDELLRYDPTAGDPYRSALPSGRRGPDDRK